MAGGDVGQLRISVLGSPEVRHDGRPVRFQTRKTAALLVYLAVEGGRHSREKLAALLWPDADEARSRGALRSTLNFLRAAIAEASEDGRPHLIADRHQLSIGEDVEIDLSGLDSASPTDDATPAQMIARLSRALALYRGDFLDGFTLGDAPAFDDWAALQREVWRRRAVALFDGLSRAQSAGGATADAIETCARWVAFDRLNEAAYRRLMRLHLTAGSPPAALRAYDACRIALATELDVEPSPETETLAARVRSRAFDASTGAAPVMTESAPAFESPLVGRLSEHASLVSAYELARRGRLQVVCVEGEPGIGKTRLAVEFLRWAEAQGADVLHGRAFESAGRLPYQPLMDALRQRLERENAPDDLLSDIWLAELARLLPELRDRYPDLPDPPMFGEEEARARLFESIARLGESLAAHGPLVLLLDDVQWADAASLDAVQYALGRWSAAGLAALVVVCVRSEDLAASPPLAEWLDGAGRDAGLARIALGPLGAEDTDRLVRSLGGAAGSEEEALDDLARWLHAETGGQPFFITEMIKALAERDLLRAEPSGGWVVAPAGSAETFAALRGVLPPGVRAVVRARLARLGATSRTLLAAAAVLGGRFEFEPACAVGGVPADDGLAAIDDLLARRLVRESAGRYVIAHDKVREVLYADAGRARRRLFHRRALDVLESRGAPAEERLHHALAAEEPTRAFRLAVMAGDEAMRVFAVRDATAHFEQAHALLDAGADHGGAAAIERAERSHLHDRLGRAYELGGRFAEAERDYAALLDIARSTDDRPLQCAALNRLATAVVNGSNDTERQAALLDEALAVAEAAGDPAGLVETEWNLARLGLFRSDVPGAWAHAGRALSLAREHGLAEPAARTLNWLAVIETMVGRYADAEAHGAEARSMYATLGDAAMEADSLTHVAGACIRLGRPRDAVAAARAARSISVAIENAWGQASACMQLTPALQECGELAEALEAGRVAVAAAAATGYPVLRLLTTGHLGSVQRSLGLTDAARATLADAWALGAQVDFPTFKEWVAGELCAAHAQAGDWAAAASFAREAQASRTYVLWYGGGTRHHEVEALLRAGDVAPAEEDVRRFEQHATGSPRSRMLYLRAAAALAAWRDRAGEAVALLEEARALATEIDLPLHRMEIAVSLAGVYRRTGEAARTDAAEAEATVVRRSIAEGIGDDELREAFLGTAVAAGAPA